MKNILKLFLVVFCILPGILLAQSYSLDTTFVPEYDFYDYPLPQTVYLIAEHENGSVFVHGAISNQSNNLGDCAHMHEDGSIYPEFDISLGAFRSHLFLTKGDTLITSRSILRKFDMNANCLNWDWGTNKFADIEHDWYEGMHLFDDGSILAVGTFDLYNDPTVYDLIRQKPDGHLDTSFYIDPIDQSLQEFLNGVLKYDENRFLGYGKFTKWFNYPIKRVCRFYNDGSIDSSFYSVFDWGDTRATYVQPDGKIIITGQFYLEGDTSFHTLMRLNPDGSLDSTFNNFNNVNINDYSHWVRTICPLPDGGYLIGGFFNSYQGHHRGNIAKIDKNGYLDTAIFSGLGFDTMLVGYNHPYPYPGVHQIVAAQNNKYYIGGGFSSFNGQAVPPFVRLLGDLESSITEPEKHTLQVYPNPANNSINISANSIINEICIYTQIGQLISVQNNRTKNTYINVSGFAPGNYFIRAMSKNEVLVSKFVIVR